MGEIKCVCIAIALKKRDLQPEVEPKLSSWVAEGCKRVAGMLWVKFNGVDGT